MTTTKTIWWFVGKNRLKKSFQAQTWFTFWLRNCSYLREMKRSSKKTENEKESLTLTRTRNWTWCHGAYLINWMPSHFWNANDCISRCFSRKKAAVWIQNASLWALKASYRWQIPLQWTPLSDPLLSVCFTLVMPLPCPENLSTLTDCSDPICLLQSFGILQPSALQIFDGNARGIGRSIRLGVRKDKSNKDWNDTGIWRWDTYISFLMKLPIVNIVCR